MYMFLILFIDFKQFIKLSTHIFIIVNDSIFI